jgi:hypothetical protein
VAKTLGFEDDAAERVFWRGGWHSPGRARRCVGASRTRLGGALSVLTLIPIVQGGAPEANDFIFPRGSSALLTAFFDVAGMLLLNGRKTVAYGVFLASICTKFISPVAIESEKFFLLRGGVDRTIRVHLGVLIGLTRFRDPSQVVAGFATATSAGIPTGGRIKPRKVLGRASTISQMCRAYDLTQFEWGEKEMKKKFLCKDRGESTSLLKKVSIAVSKRLLMHNSSQVSTWSSCMSVKPSACRRNKSDPLLLKGELPLLNGQQCPAPRF